MISKTMTPLARARLAVIIRQVALSVGIGAASPREIERLNIRRATALVMQRALRQLRQYDHILVDG